MNQTSAHQSDRGHSRDSSTLDQQSRLPGACVQMMCNIARAPAIREESGFNLHSAGITCRIRGGKGQAAPAWHFTVCFLWLRGVGWGCVGVEKHVSRFFSFFLFDSRGGQAQAGSVFWILINQSIYLKQLNPSHSLCDKPVDLHTQCKTFQIKNTYCVWNTLPTNQWSTDHENHMSNVWFHSWCLSKAVSPDIVNSENTAIL